MNKPLEQVAKPGILVDLDSLFDTRFATLELLDPRLAANALTKGYLDRLDDSFEFCSFELFKKVYEVRDIEVLGKASMTPIIDVVFDFVKEANNNLRNGKSGRYPDVYINVWPYNIDEDACGEILKPIYEGCDGKANVHLINISPKNLTPQEISKNFSYVVMYSFMDWLVAQGESGALQTNRLQHITLVGPRLYQSGKPDDSVLEEYSANGLEPHQGAELYFSPFIKLELYVPRMFSAKFQHETIELFEKEIAEAKAEAEKQTS